MSFDIIILKPSKASVADLTEVEAVTTLGSVEAVSEVFNSVFTGCLEGAFLQGEGYSVELLLSGEPVESAHLSIHFGQSWDSQSELHLHKQLKNICSSYGWVAFAILDNSRISP